MALQRSGQNLCPFDSKANPVIFNRRNRGLRYTRELRELILAKFLKLANDAHGFTNRHDYAAFSGTKLTHLRPPVIMCSD